MTQHDRFYPGLAIVPIVKLGRSTLDFRGHLGTGFFCSQNADLLSVAHVLKVEPAKDEIMAIYQVPEVGGGYGGICPVTDVRASNDFDLAVARVPDARNIQVLPVAKTDPQGMPTLFTYDYSTGLRAGRLPDGTSGRRWIPYNWTGTWLTTYEAYDDPDMPGPAKVIEVPFPVMAGASGTPLVRSDDGGLDVVGLMFGNVARDLVPPPRSSGQGRAWYLPVGRALHCQHIRAFLRSLGLFETER